mmetsp:Transcript_10013/g.14344  ORF Transcript_10013/g.14344 Transcript_10013/m.14344 type:complete len:113 (+) Transcript_10013:513-851(+)
MVRPLWRVEAPPVVILLFAAILAPLSSANADCGSVVRRGVVRSVKERRVVAAAEKRSWMDDDDDVACNSTCVLEFRVEEERPLGENAAAPPHTAEATKAVRKETILYTITLY